MKARRGPATWVAAIALTALTCGHPAAAADTDSHRGGVSTDSGRAREDREAAADGSVLILTHSWSGRTATVGSAWANMLGARFLRYSDGPQMYPSAGAQGATLKEIVRSLDVHGVRRIYLGFPIWMYGPAPPVTELVSGLDLSGVEVVPFFTYLHGVDENAVRRLEDRLRAAGGKILPRIAMRVPMSMSREHLEQRAYETFLTRGDLWRTEAAPVARCSSESAPAGHTLCHVPEGNVWLGEDGSETSPPGAASPRRVHVSTFEIDRTEVTLAQYRRCTDTGSCAVIERSDLCKALAEDGDDKPVSCISRDAAHAYCGWAGMRLPNEAEWTRAARGERVTPYPWGDEPPGASGIARGNFSEKQGAGVEGYSLVEPERNWPVDGVARLATGCSFPQGNSPFGVCDLAGNIAEWVEPVDEGSIPVFKGGTWADPDPWTFRVASRGNMSLDRAVTSVGFYLTGFRCARSVKR